MRKGEGEDVFALFDRWLRRESHSSWSKRGRKGPSFPFWRLQEKREINQIPAPTSSSFFVPHGAVFELLEGGEGGGGVRFFRPPLTSSCWWSGRPLSKKNVGGLFMKEVLFRSDTSPKKGRTPLLFFRKSTKSSFGDEGGAGHFVRLLSWELTSAKELCVLFRLICVRRPEPPPPISHVILCFSLLDVFLSHLFPWDPPLCLGGVRGPAAR